MFRRILIAVDLSDASRAALYAGISLASRCSAPVDVIKVIPYFANVYQTTRYVFDEVSWKTEFEKELESFFPTSLYPNSRRKIVVGENVSDMILEHARTEKCDLIVAGSHGRRGIARTLMGSVTQKLARSSGVPVMIVRDVEHVEEKYQGFDHILATTDFSDASMKAVGLASRFANFLRADFDLIHVVDLPALKEVGKSYMGVTLPEKKEMNVDITLQKMIESRELIGKATVATLYGDPAEEILNYAKEKEANFIFLGTHGRKGLERILIGSVTAAVISRSEIPVVTIAMRD